MMVIFHQGIVFNLFQFNIIHCMGYFLLQNEPYEMHVLEKFIFMNFVSAKECHWVATKHIVIWL